MGGSKTTILTFKHKQLEANRSFIQQSSNLEQSRAVENIEKKKNIGSGS